MLIEKHLINYGFSPSRVKDLALGLEAMHKSIALMDSNNREILNEKSLIEWINYFATVEELAQI